MTFAADGAAELWNRWAEERDPQVREELILFYKEWVWRIARHVKKMTPLVETEEMMSAGMLGLIQAFDKYDPHMGVPFVGFAGQRVKGAMMDALRNIDWAPTRVRSNTRMYYQAKDELRHRLNREATDEEMCKYLNISQEELVKQRKEQDKTGISNLDEFVEMGIEPISTEEGPEEVATGQTILLKQVKQAIWKLSEQKQRVMHMYYDENMSMEEIGEVLGVTLSRISQIHSDAITDLREIMLKAA